MHENEDKNLNESFYVASLIVKHLKGELTEKEEQYLNNWLAESEQNRLLFWKLTNEERLESQSAEFISTDVEAAWRRLQAKMVTKTSRKASGRIWMAAAAVSILAIASWELLQVNVPKHLSAVTLTSKYGDDVLPGTQKAKLVLSNGNIITLSKASDSMFNDNGSDLTSSNGSITYKTNKRAGEERYNTLVIPEGGEYKVELEDGTKVWLNAATSFRYPLQFAANERKVELLSGEAYFEVVKNKLKPFVVIVNKINVQDIGTAFEINAYNNTDSLITTTLTEGVIKVSAMQKDIVMKPGEQLLANKQAIHLTTTDTAMTIAWKNGLFMFQNTPLQQVTEQIARWYNVNIVYDTGFTEKKFFTGEIKRNIPLSKLLQIMELTGIARFTITNNTVVLKPFAG